MRIGKSFVMLSLIASAYLYADSTKLGDVTVTANKIEESIMDVPQSITVISEGELEEKRLYDLNQVIREIPNMNSRYDGALTQITFRGLTSSTFTNANPVVIYVDGVPYYDSYDVNPSLANVEQIEVLRGPQGTLYGKDAIGGVINIITKAPTNEWSGTLGAEYGSDNYMRASLNTSGAIIYNKLFVGINGTYQGDEGWITNSYPGSKKDANGKSDRKASAFLLYQPTDKLSAKFMLSDNYKEVDFFDGLFTDPSIDINDLDRDDAKNANFEVPTFSKTSVKAQSLNIGYEFENMKLEAVSTHKKVNSDAEFDGDRLTNQIHTDSAGNMVSFDGAKSYSYQDIETYTQEIKLSSKNQNIKWVTGIYFDKEEREHGPFGEDTLNRSRLGILTGGYSLYNADSTSNSETQAIFGQAIIPLYSNFELTLGGRYQRIKKEIDSLTTFGMAPAFRPDGKYSDENTYNAFLPKVALVYSVNDDISTYVSIAQGYAVGGFNFFAGSPNSITNSFDSQKSINYEIGLKMQEENYIFNIAVFRMNITDLHVYRYVFGSAPIVFNAPKAHSQGIEFDGTYLLSEALSISGAVGLLETKYDDYVGYDGKRIAYVPEYTANLGISYLSNKGIYGRLDFNLRGSIAHFDRVKNNQLTESDGGVVSNIKIGYKINDWDIYTYMTNITDETIISSFRSTHINQVTFNDPRRFGIGVKYNF